MFISPPAHLKDSSFRHCPGPLGLTQLKGMQHSLHEHTLLASVLPAHVLGFP